MYTDYYVYVLFRETGIPFYVGMGRNGRIDKHLVSHKHYDHHKDRIVRNLLNSIGDVPRVKIREGLTREEAAKVEVAFIAAVGREPTGPLVNITAGGEGVVGLTPEVELIRRARVAESKRGTKMPQEVKDKIAATKKAQAVEKRRLNPESMKLSEEHRKKISAAKMGHTVSEESRRKSAEAQRGRKLSEEHRAKLSLSAKRRMANITSEDKEKQLKNLNRDGGKISPEARKERDQRAAATRKANAIARRYRLGEEYRRAFSSQNHT